MTTCFGLAADVALVSFFQGPGGLGRGPLAVSGARKGAPVSVSLPGLWAVVHRWSSTVTVVLQHNHPSHLAASHVQVRHAAYALHVALSSLTFLLPTRHVAAPTRSDEHLSPLAARARCKADDFQRRGPARAQSEKERARWGETTPRCSVCCPTHVGVVTSVSVCPMP